MKFILSSIGRIAFCVLPLPIFGAVKESQPPQKMESQPRLLTDSGPTAAAPDEQYSSSDPEDLPESHQRLMDLHNGAIEVAHPDGYSSAYIICKPSRFQDQPHLIIKAQLASRPHWQHECDETLRSSIERVNAALRAGPYYSASCVVPNEVFAGDDSLTLRQLGESWRVPSLKAYGKSIKKNKPDFDKITRDTRLVYSVQEYRGEDVLEYLIRCDEAEMLRIPRRIVAKLFLGMVSICKCMGEQNISHQDAGPSNIAMYPDGTPTLIDFGMYTTLRETSDHEFVATKDHARVLPYLRSQLYKKGPRVNVLSNVTKNLMRAQDLWCCVVLLHYTLFAAPPAKHKRNTKYLERMHKQMDFYEEISNDKLCEVYGKGRGTVIHKVLIPLVKRLGTISDFTENVDEVIEDILVRPFGAPIRAWVKSEDPADENDLINEATGFADMLGPHAGPCSFTETPQPKKR